MYSLYNTCFELNRTRHEAVTYQSTSTGKQREARWPTRKKTGFNSYKCPSFLFTTLHPNGDR